MTALEKYIRLEALGIWRESASAPPREVVVSLRDATLVLTDLAERPLGHWALAGTRPLGVADGATVFSMTTEGEESLAIRDTDMINAITAVSRDYRGVVPTPPPRRQRFPLLPLLVVCLLLCAAVYGPGLLREQAARMMPSEQARDFGDRMLAALLETHGPLCADPAGNRALTILGTEVAEDVPLQVLNLGGAASAVALPGPVILIDAQSLDRAASPDELVGWITAALGTNPAQPVRQLTEATGPLTSLRYILTGRISDADLATAAEAAIKGTPPDQGFVPALGYSEPLLSDQQWMALRGICG